MANIQELRIADIRTDGGTQPRAQLDMATLIEYTEAMQNGATFPPVTVYYDGESYWLADGFHRLHAAQDAKRTTIAADVKRGTCRDAVLYSVGANAAHGLRRTNADKRRAVETLLRDEEWRQWSDREIARRAAVDFKTVGNIRRDLSVEFPQIERKVTRNGTTYPINTANIGSKPGEPAPEAETVTVDRDELGRLRNIEEWAKYEGGYYGENEAYGEWGSHDEEEEDAWNETRSGATPLSAYIPKVTPTPADEGDTVSIVDVGKAIADERKETPNAQSIPFSSLLLRLDSHRVITERNIESWLDVTPPEQWVIATANFKRLRAFMDGVERRMSERQSPRLRVIQ